MSIIAAISNTIVVDDYPYKHAFNPNECGLFLNPFINNMVEDAVMTKVLLPFFENMFYSPMFDACTFVLSHRFGQQPIKHNDAIKLAISQSNIISKQPDL